jgi:hypothetical protein
LFQDKNIRTIWDEEQEKWYFSVIDVSAVLTDSENPRKYWSVLKTRLKAEGSQLATNCSHMNIKFTAAVAVLLLAAPFSWAGGLRKI